MEKILEKTKKILKEILVKMQRKDLDQQLVIGKEKTVKRKYAFTLSFTALTLLSLLFLGCYPANQGYKVIFNGEEIGIVKRQKDFTGALDKIQEEIIQAQGEKVYFPQEVSFEKIKVDKEDMMSQDGLMGALSKNLTLKIPGAIIKVDGKPMAMVEDKKIAEEILEEIQQPYRTKKDHVEIKEVDFVEKIEILEEDIPLEKMMSKEKALKSLAKETDQVEVYQVALGDTTWDISREFDIGIREIEKNNPDTDITALRPGDEINIKVPKPLINVKSVQVVTSTKQIPYETIFQEDKNLEKGKQKVLREGKYGTEEITEEIIMKNGIEEEIKVLSQKTVKEPTDKVVAKGTKMTSITGQFAKPASGRIPSGGLFGSSRSGGRRHAGLDISNASGTPIYAADGGSVTGFMGYRGGYGYVVEINHGKGYTTRYAHLNKILVSPGQKVAKGQHIANMGNTGNSTGPHLHFEVRKGGNPQNPLQYIPR